MYPNHTQQQISKIKRWLGTGSINLFGRPFAGKDTQGRTLAELLDGVLIGGGDILRSQGAPDRTMNAINAGFMAPTDDYRKIVLPYLQKSEFKNQPLILSSVGRWFGEETAVVQAANQSGHPLKAVFYLNVSEATVRQRWGKSQDERSAGDRGSRVDDAIEKLATRLEEFRYKTLPVLDYYRQSGLLHEVVGDKLAAIEVTAQILDHLLALAKAG